MQRKHAVVDKSSEQCGSVRDRGSEAAKAAADAPKPEITPLVEHWVRLT